MAIRENYSRKREAVYEVVASTDSHPSVDWVYEQIRKIYPDVSLATVYRNLKRFCEQGRVRSIGVVNGQERFDADMSDHSHFVCTECGAVLNVPDAFQMPERLKTLSEQYGLEFHRSEVRFTGVCSECKALQGEDENEAEETA